MFLLLPFRLFGAAKAEAADPMTAAKVYDKIVDQISDAKNLSSQVTDIVDQIFLVVFPPSERELSIQASEALNKSSDLETFAAELLGEDVLNLQDQLDEENGRLDGVNATNQRTGVELDGISDRLELLPFGKTAIQSWNIHGKFEILFIWRSLKWKDIIGPRNI